MPIVSKLGSIAEPVLSVSSEDCLYLNIYTPNAKPTTLYPVMVWIHGGGLITGDSHFWVTGIIRTLVVKGVVVVSIDYRMSFLGFFTTFTDDFPPNLGMLDQVLALKFIKEEISFFGGDPNRITMFGESAGGHSVSSLTYSPLSQNLFQQYIVESGTVFTCYEDSVGPTNRNFNFAKVACNYTQEMWDSGNFTALKSCLQNMNVLDALQLSLEAGAWNAVCWNMVQDNYFIPDLPQNLQKKRPIIPAIIGNCKDEYSLGESQNAEKNISNYNRVNVEYFITHQWASWWGNKSETILKIFEDNYLPPGIADDDYLGWLQFYVKVGTPAYFTWGILREIEYWLQNNNPNVYAYEFSWSSHLNNAGYNFTDWKPVPHGCEIIYLFNYGNQWDGWSVTDIAIADYLQTFWTNFAKFGKPSTDGQWQPVTSKDPTKLEYFEFYNISTMKTGYRAVDQIVWNQKIPAVVGDSPPNLPDNYKLCQRGYQSSIKNSICYEAFGNTLTWNAAQTACSQNSYGTLVNIGSAFENSDLLGWSYRLKNSNKLGYAKKAFPSCSSFYIGRFRSASLSVNGNWSWANYDTNIYSNWKNGYPTADPNSRCAVLNTNDGIWINQDCSMPQCYICSLSF